MIGTFTITVDKEIEFESSIESFLERVKEEDCVIKDYNVKCIEHYPETNQVCYTTDGKKAKYLEALNICRQKALQFFFEDQGYIAESDDITIEYTPDSLIMKAYIDGVHQTYNNPYYVEFTLKKEITAHIDFDKQNGRIFVWQAGSDSYDYW